MDAKARYEAWLTDPLIDEATKAELRALAQNGAELEDRFYKWVEFGTGGLRGTMGAGTNRINIYTIRLATQALALTLKEGDLASRGVVIAYDSRRLSREFAQAAAGVLVANGIPVHLFPEVAPTPLLSFAVRHLQAGAGIVITASHNPPEYNGYKVYNAQGGQILNREAEKISSCMARLSLSEVHFTAQPLEHPLLRLVDQQLVEAYYQAMLDAVPPLQHAGSLGIMYTPLHGTGGRHVPEILRRAGFSRLGCVPEQMEPDGDFPTVQSPNPEDGRAFGLAFAQAQEDCQLILATDPDADRLGVAVRHQGEWVLLNGNQLGVLLADYLLQRARPEQLQGGVLIKTIVTTELLEPLARKYGVEVRNTLTGFKYIGALMDELPREGKHFLFGFEESYGYLVGSYARDKDAVVTSLLTAQVAAYYAARGLDLVQRLEQLFQEHGWYQQALESYSFASSLEAERARMLLQRLREHPLSVIGQERVVEIRDFGRSEALKLTTGERLYLDLPKEDVLQWFTEAGSKVSLRPSGTEPKIKLYLEVQGPTQAEAGARLAKLKEACRELIASGLEEG